MVEPLWQGGSSYLEEFLFVVAGLTLVRPRELKSPLSFRHFAVPCCSMLCFERCCDHIDAFDRL